MKNVIKKEEYLNTQIENLLKLVEYEDFDDVDEMKDHIKKIHLNIILLKSIIDFVYK